MINKLERAHNMMRHLYQHPHSTSDQLAHALNIPPSSVRRTLAADYPKSFAKHRLGGYVLPDPIIWPEDLEFDLAQPIMLDEEIPPEPESDDLKWYRDRVEELTKLLNKAMSGQPVNHAPPVGAKTPSDSFTLKRPTQAQFDRAYDEIRKMPLYESVKASVADRQAPDKSDDEYWRWYNFFKAGLIAMSIAIAKDPEAKLKEYVK